MHCISLSSEVKQVTGDQQSQSWSTVGPYAIIAVAMLVVSQQPRFSHTEAMQCSDLGHIVGVCAYLCVVCHRYVLSYICMEPLDHCGIEMHNAIIESCFLHAGFSQLGAMSTWVSHMIREGRYSSCCGWTALLTKRNNDCEKRVWWSHKNDEKNTFDNSEEVLRK